MLSKEERVPWCKLQMKQLENPAKNVIQLEEFYQASNLKAKEYSITFNTLKEVLGECYQYQLHRGFQNNIKIFTEAYLDLKIIVIYKKMHSFMHHVTKFCHFTGKCLVMN